MHGNKYFLSIAIISLTSLVQYLNIYYSETLPFLVVITSGLVAGVIKLLEKDFDGRDHKKAKRRSRRK